MSEQGPAEQPRTTMTLIAGNGDARIFTGLAWLSGIKPIPGSTANSLEEQTKQLEAVVAIAREDALPPHVDQNIVVHCDPQYWSLRFTLPAEEAVALATVIALELGTVSLIKLKSVEYGVSELGKIAVPKYKKP